ncbi:MAG: CNNM domain-containing protein [Planctomycetota bacterium]
MTAALPEWTSWLIWPTLMVAAMCFDALFSGLETGVYVMNKLRLELHADSGHEQARRVQRLLSDTPNVLAVLLVGVNVARYVDTFCITAMFILAGYGRNAEWMTLAVATPTLFVLTESVPKVVFQRRGAPAVYRFAGLLRAGDVLLKLTGVSWLIRGVGRLLVAATGGRRSGGEMLAPSGLSALVAEGRAAGALTPFQSVMADRIAHINEVTLEDVMVPMSRVVSAPVDVTREQLLALIAEHDYSRIPLIGERGQVAGICDVYETLIAADESPPRQRAAAPLLIPADTVVTEVLWRMQRTRAHQAVVVRDERHVGIVTIKDLVEEIVGELQAW